MSQNQNLKKQGLLLIIDSYLSQPTPEALLFLDKHISSTEELAFCLGSHIQLGLSTNQLRNNQEFYGKNTDQVDELSGCQRFCKIMTQQLFRMRTGFILLTIIFQIVCAYVWQIYELKIASITVVVSIVLSWVIRIGLELRERIIIEHRINIKEPNTVYVYRNGSKFAVSEDQITVGDLLFVDYNQIVPATGIIISNEPIEVNQSKYGRSLQTKLPLEHCLEMLAKKNELQLRMDVQTGTLASPIVIRGTINSTGKTFKMLVLAVQEHNILSKHMVKKQNQKSFSTIQGWINNTTAFVSKVTNIILSVIIFFHIMALVFKIKGAPPDKFVPMAKTIIENTQAFVCLFLLLDASLLKCLLRGSYLQVVGMLSSRQNIDRLLSVEQLFLTEESICKYDTVQIHKVMLVDSAEPVDIQVFPAIQPQEPYYILHEILAGVGLEKELLTPTNPKKHENTIIHILGLQERVFSSLFSNDPKVEQKPEEQIDSIGQMMKTQGMLMRKNINAEKSSEEKQNKQKSQSIKLAFQLEQSSNIQILKKQDNPLGRLDQYLVKHCRFSTQNIVEGIKTLAKNMSRTYFFQRFSLERLSQIKKVWSEGNYVDTTIIRQEKILLGIKRLQKEGLTPYLVGFDEGAFSKQYMNFLLGVVGVKLTPEKQVVKKMQKLEQIGVNTLFTIKQMEEKLTDKQKLMIERQFHQRDWAQAQHQFVEMNTIKQKGGRMICTECLTSRCTCRCRKQELANPQGFLESVSDVRCVWGVGQKDLTYLQRGYEQLGMTTLSLTDHYEDIPRKMEQIIAGNQLFYALQQNLALWISWIAIISLCIFPYNYLTFDHIISHPQLFVFLVVFQLLMVKHQVSGSDTLLASKKLSLSKRRRKVMGVAIKFDIVVFAICLTVGCFLAISNPLWFSGPLPREGLSGYTCNIIPSFYHNPWIANTLCHNNGLSKLLFSKVSTFIFLFILLAIIFRSAITVHNPFGKSNIIFHLSLIGTLLFLIYFCPEIMQVSINALSCKQLGVNFGAAIGSVCISLLCRAGLLLTELGKISHFQIKIGLNINQYTQLLKQYKQGRTLNFPLEKEQCTL